MFPLNSHDQYIDENGKRSSLSELFEGSEHDIEELEQTVAGHTTAIGALQTKTGALQDQISTDEYSAESGYTAGDYVIHDNKLYKCNTTCTADTWANNSGYFTETSVTDEIANLNSDLNADKLKIGTPFLNTFPQTVGDTLKIDVPYKYSNFLIFIMDSQDHVIFGAYKPNYNNSIKFAGAYNNFNDRAIGAINCPIKSITADSITIQTCTSTISNAPFMIITY